MSTTFQARESAGQGSGNSRGKNSSFEGTTNLLVQMKLRAPNDLVVFEQLLAWVARQDVSQQISPSHEKTTRIATTLLLQRLVRAFEQRAPKVTTSTTTTTTTPDGTESIAVTSIVMDSSSANNSTKNNIPAAGAAAATPKKKSKLGKKNSADLSALMLRRVKVTRMVQQSVQFIGSDILQVLTASPQSPMVADVAHSCLLILKTGDTIKELYTIFCIASKKDTTTLDENATIYFGVFAMQSLETLRAQAVSRAELAYDFEFLYHKCYEHASFQACFNALNPPLPPSTGVAPDFGFGDDVEARIISWKLSRLLALKSKYITKRESETQAFRRNHIISSAAAILIAADLGKWSIVSTLGVSSSSSSSSSWEEHMSAHKRQKVDYAGSFPNFVDLILEPISELVRFLTKNSYNYNDMEPISKDDIQQHMRYVARLIEVLPSVQQAKLGTVNNGTLLGNFTTMTHGEFFASASYTTAKRNFVLDNYRRVIYDIVEDTKKKLDLNFLNPRGPCGDRNRAGKSSSDRAAIGNVLFFFPMVIGEKWGIHRDEPLITTNLMCSLQYSTPSMLQRDSVGLVISINGNAMTSHKGGAPARPQGSPNIYAPMHPNPLDLNRASESREIIVIDDEDSPEARPAGAINMEVNEPPLIDDSMELNEWTLSILSLSVVKPSDTLLTYLCEHDRRQVDASSCLKDVIVPVLNRGVIRIHGAITSTQPVGGREARLSIGRRDGQVYVNGEVDDTVQLCASVVGFYYHSLECIIRDQMNRIEFLDSFNALLQSDAFHRALLACCYSCVLKGVGTTQKILGHKSKDCTLYFLMDTVESNPYTFLKVTDAFRRALILSDDSTKGKTALPVVPGLPAVLQQHIQTLEIKLVDSLLWAETVPSRKSEGSLPATIQNVRNFPGAWPPDILEPSLPEEFVDLNGTANGVDVRYKSSYTSSAESGFLSYVLRKLLTNSFSRIQAICAALNMSDDVLVHTQTLVAFRLLLRNNIEIFFDRHVDQLLLCTIYGVCKVMQVRPEVTFGKLIGAYCAVRGKEQGERSCRVIIRHVKLVSSGDEVRSDGRLVGNLIEFYNQIYVPKIHKHFFGSKSLERSIAEHRIQQIARSDHNRPLANFVDLVTDAPAKNGKSSVDASSSRHGDAFDTGAALAGQSPGSLSPRDPRGKTRPTAKVNSKMVERKDDGFGRLSTVPNNTPTAQEVNTNETPSTAVEEQLGLADIAIDSVEKESVAEQTTPSVVEQMEIDNLEVQINESALGQSNSEESAVRLNLASAVDATETVDKVFFSGTIATLKEDGGEGTESAQADATRGESVDFVERGRVDNSDSNAKTMAEVLLADNGETMGNIETVMTLDIHDSGIDIGTLPELSVISPSLGIEAKPDGEGSNRSLCSVADTSSSHDNSSPEEPIDVPLANEKQIPHENEEKPVSGLDADNPQGCFGGGDTEGTYTVVAMDLDEVERVHIVEKNYIQNPDSTIENGSPKWSFPTVGATDNDASTETFGNVGFFDQNGIP
jgi:hypothetical protein